MERSIRSRVVHGNSHKQARRYKNTQVDTGHWECHCTLAGAPAYERLHLLKKQHG